MAGKAFVRAKLRRAFIREQVMAGKIPNGGAGKINVPDGSFQPYAESMEQHRMLAAGYRAPYVVAHHKEKKG